MCDSEVGSRMRRSCDGAGGCMGEGCSLHVGGVVGSAADGLCGDVYWRWCCGR